VRAWLDNQYSGWWFGRRGPTEWPPLSPDNNPLTPNTLKRRRAVSLLKIKIPSKNMREKPANTPIIHSVY
jgi:hypothetical protein